MDWQPKNSDLAGVLRRERRDDLTGLLSMMDFMERADREIARGPATFLYFNVENFRLMNQEYGFQAGNQLLVRIAEALLETFGPVPMARLNDDRFIVMTRSTGLEEHIQAVVETVDQIEARMSLAVKVGIYDPPPDVTDVALIMDRAKLACDSIKGIYDKRCAHFTKGLETQRSLRTYIVTNFYRALEEGWIEVWYQPEIRAATREVCGFEALARWRDPERGIISPGDFIPVLERAHLINRLDLYVIQRVCSDQQKGKERPSWKSSHISVNLSRVDFQLSNMLEEIQSICRAYDVPEGYLHIEITESALNDNDEFLRHEIQRFHDAGFELWMDDFGSGYSSLNNLKDFQFDLLKIDMGFLRDFDTKPQARVILEAIVDMAKKLGIHTLCEGVETEEQYKFLKDIGCEILQGYLFSPPVPYFDEHTGEVSGSKENLLVIEGTEAEDYFRTIGSFNVLDADPLRFSKDSWGLAIAILECRDDGSCRYLYANDRVREMAIPDGFHNLEEAIRDRRTGTTSCSPSGASGTSSSAHSRAASRNRWKTSSTAAPTASAWCASPATNRAASPRSPTRSSTSPTGASSTSSASWTSPCATCSRSTRASTSIPRTARPKTSSSTPRSSASSTSSRSRTRDSAATPTCTSTTKTAKTSSPSTT